MEEIIWKPVTGFQGLYKISNTGRIVSFHKRNYEQEISQRIDRAGYFTVRLSKDGKTSTQYVHRLVACAFIDNTENKLYVNHINRDKQDNRDINLEFVTHAENILHAYKIGIERLTYKVVDSCTGAIYQSIKEAADKNGISYSHCKNFLNGTRKNKTCLRLVA